MNREEGKEGKIYNIDGISYIAVKSWRCHQCVAYTNKELCHKLPTCILADFETSLIYKEYAE